MIPLQAKAADPHLRGGEVHGGERIEHRSAVPAAERGVWEDRVIREGF